MQKWQCVGGTMNSPEQTLIHEKWEAVIWRDNSEIVYSYSEDLQEESIYWLFLNLFCLAFSISTPMHSRSTLQINYLRPSFCLRILEKLILRHAALSNPILWSSTGWWQRNKMSPLTCPSFLWNSRNHSLSCGIQVGHSKIPDNSLWDWMVRLPNSYD